MIKKVISYFNKKLGFYENLKCVENQSNVDIIGSCKRYLNLAPVQEAAACAGSEIRIIGEFDDESESSPLVSYEVPVFVVDCDEILKTRFPHMYEESDKQ